ncbi:hypothetical protein XELAEV_18024827mg, partial [Xenopus laevis]
MSFAYTNEEVLRITTAVKGNSEFLSQHDVLCDFREIEKLHRKSIAWDLHLRTMAEYVRLQRIPRGLRSHLRPTLFADDEEFTKKWESILNKCSLDLMVALMEKIQKESPALTLHITKKEAEMRNHCAEKEVSEGQLTMQDSLNKFRVALEVRKRDKFRRDAEDYSTGLVYRWRSMKDQRQHVGWNRGRIINRNGG